MINHILLPEKSTKNQLIYSDCLKKCLFIAFFVKTILYVFFIASVGNEKLNSKNKGTLRYADYFILGEVSKTKDY